MYKPALDITLNDQLIIPLSNTVSTAAMLHSNMIDELRRHG